MSEFAATLHDPASIAPFRLVPTAFTRQRTLTAPRLLVMMISGVCSSVQAALDDLFAQVNGSRVRVRACTDRAFAKARRGVSWEVFNHLNRSLLRLAQPWIDAHRWRGLRVVAADGTRLRVATREGAQLQADHYAFALYLPGAELTLHAALGTADASERQMLFEAIEHTEPDDLLVLDRGLTGNTMVAALVQNGRHFCLRVDASGYACVKRFLRSGEAERTVTLCAPKAADAAAYELKREPTRVRLIRDVTPAGSVRVLMTSLLDGQRYQATAFGALYHRRWRVEEAFKRIKHRLRLEAVTVLTHLAFQQDFAAKILADNLHSLLSEACTTSPLDEDDPAPRSHVNRTYAFGALRPILAGCLLAVRACRRALRAALEAIVQSRCRIQPGRSYPRRSRTKPHVYSAYKTHC